MMYRNKYVCFIAMPLLMNIFFFLVYWLFFDVMPPVRLLVCATLISVINGIVLVYKLDIRYKYTQSILTFILMLVIIASASFKF